MKKVILLLTASVLFVTLFGCVFNAGPVQEEGKTVSIQDNTAVPQKTDESDNNGVTAHDSEIYEHEWEREGLRDFSIDDMWEKTDAKYEGDLFGDSFSMSADEFKNELIDRYGISDFSIKHANESSPDRDFIMKKGVVSVYTYDDICLALVLTEDTYHLDNMKLIVFRAGAYVEYHVYALGDLAGGFAASAGDVQVYNSAIYMKEYKGNMLLFIEDGCEVDNFGLDVKTYFVEGTNLTLYSDLYYSEGYDYASSDLLPHNLNGSFKRHEDDSLYNSRYILYDAERTDNIFSSSDAALAAYYKCFGINRKSALKKSDVCALDYDKKGITKIMDFFMHPNYETSEYTFGMTDYTGIKK